MKELASPTIIGPTPYLVLLHLRKPNTTLQKSSKGFKTTPAARTNASNFAVFESIPKASSNRFGSDDTCNPHKRFSSIVPPLERMETQRAVTEIKFCKTISRGHCIGRNRSCFTGHSAAWSDVLRTAKYPRANHQTVQAQHETMNRVYREPCTCISSRPVSPKSKRSNQWTTKMLPAIPRFSRPYCLHLRKHYRTRNSCPSTASLPPSDQPFSASVSRAASQLHGERKTGLLRSRRKIRRVVVILH